MATATENTPIPAAILAAITADRIEVRRDTAAVAAATIRNGRAVAVVAAATRAAIRIHPARPATAPCREATDRVRHREDIERILLCSKQP